MLGFSGQDAGSVGEDGRREEWGCPGVSGDADILEDARELEESVLTSEAEAEGI